MDKMIRMTRKKVALAFSSGLLLGLAFPPSTFGLLACVGLVPFLFLLDRLDRYSEVGRYGYLTFLIFNLVTLYWIGGYTHGNDKFLMLGGAAVVLVHPFFFLVPTLAYVFIRKSLGDIFALVSLPFLWVGFEWIHSLGELAFPWLTLGNTQTYALDRIQFITFTGVYGITFWIVALNALIYFLVRKVIKQEWRLTSRNSILLAVTVVIIAVLPTIHGNIVLRSALSKADTSSVRVGILQPNIDPWKKWETGPEDQLRHYLRLSEVFVGQNVDMIIWPETAISFRILSGRYIGLYDQLKETIDSLGISLLTGFADIVFYEGKDAPVSSKVIPGTNIHYDDFNAIMFIEPQSDRIQKYAKMKLVPFAERVPYAEKLGFLVEAVKWNVGISGWGIGKDTTVFEMTRGYSSTKFSAMVCYESIYPDLVARFVKRGAEFLIVITNDSWYGNTSGPYQHAQYAILRAIENRRSIARCANGGISSLIDPYGRVYEKRGMFTQAFIVGDVRLSKEETFYSKHGDVFAKGCTVVGLAGVVLAVAIKVVRRSMQFRLRVRQRRTTKE